jgi:hypothetical protein
MLEQAVTLDGRGFDGTGWRIPIRFAADCARSVDAFVEDFGGACGDYGGCREDHMPAIFDGKITTP